MLGLYARIKKRDRPVRVEEPANRSAHEQEDLTRAIHAKVSLSRNQCCGSGSVGPLVRGTDPDLAPDPSVIKQKLKKNLDSYCFVNSF
jgi:hypothetical protein